MVVRKFTKTFFGLQSIFLKKKCFLENQKNTSFLNFLWSLLIGQSFTELWMVQYYKFESLQFSVILTGIVDNFSII